MIVNRLDDCKEGRWFQIVERSLQHLPFWAVIDLGGTYIGTVPGWSVDYMINALEASVYSGKCCDVLLNV